ncbi:Mitochondrial ribonuclease P catalytic subunit [Nymphon striatum]|nr:Mitochondrial ribonuclease P catalytic subunit [Nymphon striatum]
MLSHRFHNFVRLFNRPKTFNINNDNVKFMSDQRNLSVRKNIGLKKQKRNQLGFDFKSVEPLFSSVCDSKSAISLQEWRKLESDVSEKNTHISNQLFEGITMRMLTAACCPVDVFHSFLEYIQNSRGNVEVFTLAQFISYYSTKDKCDEALILKVYEEILARSRVMDNVTSGWVINAICHTHRWKDSIEIVERMSAILQLKPSVYIDISSAAFDNNEPSIGWEYFGLLQKRDAIPQSKNLIAVINWCKRLMKENINESKKEMKKLFQLLQETQIGISFEVYNCLYSYFESLPEEKWKINLTHINLRNCNCCGHLMANNKITNEECTQLKEDLIKDVTIGGDIFRNSSPQEMKRFFGFMESHEPFDIVIDGLNISFAQFHKQDVFALIYVIRHVFDMGMRKILVIGRNHLVKSIPKTHIAFFNSSAKFFAPSNISQDDPFFLMAALISGPQTKIISNDMLRDHKCLLNSSTSNIFKRWQQYNQIYFEIEKRKVILKPTIEYMQATQCSDDWSILHVPYCKDSVEKVRASKHNNWICIRRDVP